MSGLEAKLTQNGEGSEWKAILTTESGETGAHFVVLVVVLLSALLGRGPKSKPFCLGLLAPIEGD